MKSWVGERWFQAVWFLALAAVFIGMTAGISGKFSLAFLSGFAPFAAVAIIGAAIWGGVSLLRRAQSEVVALVAWVASVAVTTLAGGMSFFALASITVAVLAIWFGWLSFLRARAERAAAEQWARDRDRLMPR